jgi:hypothetical protein
VSIPGETSAIERRMLERILAILATLRYCARGKRRPARASELRDDTGQAMTICLYANVKNRGHLVESELCLRLNQLALCCRGLEILAADLPAERIGDARKLAQVAARVAEQSERLARAFAAETQEPRS